MSEMQATAQAPATTAASAVPASARAAKPGEVLIRPITVAEYYRMAEVGILGPEERVELLDGQLIAMPPGGPPHAYSVHRVASYFFKRFGDRAYVSVQAPMSLDRWSEPEPDVMLSALPEERYSVAHPTPADVLLVVEVAASSLRYDARRKLRAYARCGVREYWILDLSHERVDVHSEPIGERYEKHRCAVRGQSVAPLAFPDDPIVVDDILPPSR